MKLNEKQLQIFAWGLSGLVSLVAIYAWGQLYDWDIAGLSTYQLFPLFGLLAFSLMWSHYIVAVARLYSAIDSSVTKPYFEATSFVVLVAILLHPGLLAWQLWRDGAGLPPASELEYVVPALRGLVVLGMTAWLVFLAYELRRWLKTKAWWKYVQYLNDLAMLAIYYHGLKLGSHLGGGWFRGVWLFYGLSFIVALIFIYSRRFARARV